jgi:hypothetical protein
LFLPFFILARQIELGLFFAVFFHAPCVPVYLTASSILILRVTRTLGVAPLLLYIIDDRPLLPCSAILSRFLPRTHTSGYNIQKGKSAHIKLKTTDLFLYNLCPLESEKAGRDEGLATLSIGIHHSNFPPLCTNKSRNQRITDRAPAIIYQCATSASYYSS